MLLSKDNRIFISKRNDMLLYFCGHKLRTFLKKDVDLTL